MSSERDEMFGGLGEGVFGEIGRRRNMDREGIS